MAFAALVPTFLRNVGLRLSERPKAMQRPIVVTDRGARIGRPPESVLEILE